ncbi:hypothetical protein D3C81_1349170 [compost metagenome]
MAGQPAAPVLQLHAVLAQVAGHAGRHHVGQVMVGWPQCRDRLRCFARVTDDWLEVVGVPALAQVVAAVGAAAAVFHADLLALSFLQAHEFSLAAISRQ